MKEETAKELLWAIRQLTDAIRDYAKIKERGISLAARIEEGKVYSHYGP